MEETSCHSRNAKSRTAFHAERRRTGVRLADLLAGPHDDAPEGLDLAEIERFYRGETSGIRGDHLDYVTRLWRALPDRHRGVVTGAAREASKKKEKTDLTPEIRTELLGHWMRVGLSVEAFFERLKNPPSRLSRRMIERWIGYDFPRRVRKDHLELVRAAWERLPGGLGHVKNIHFVPFTAEIRRDAVTVSVYGFSEPGIDKRPAETRSPEKPLP